MKYPCKDCKERTIEPNCHDKCERYQEAKQLNDKIKDERRKASVSASYSRERNDKLMKERNRK